MQIDPLGLCDVIEFPFLKKEQWEEGEAAKRGEGESILGIVIIIHEQRGWILG